MFIHQVFHTTYQSYKVTAAQLSSVQHSLVSSAISLHPFEDWHMRRS